MAKKPTTPKRKPGTTYMFPWLHKDISKAISAAGVSSRWVDKKGSKNDPEEEYPTNVMGKFKCTNDACKSPGWGSKTVSILIRKYPGNGYNAVIFNQRCKECDTLGELTLDKDSYVERVAYRLMKWAGVQMERPHYTAKEGPPHERKLCEGCKRGYCQQRYDEGILYAS